LKTAKPQDPHTRYRLHTVPGIGQILSLVIRYDIHPIERFPRVQDLASDGRLIKCTQASHGNRSGTSGSQMGHAPLQGAFSEAAL
jgi:hypothetical protein